MFPFQAVFYLFIFLYILNKLVLFCIVLYCKKVRLVAWTVLAALRCPLSVIRVHTHGKLKSICYKKKKTSVIYLAYGACARSASGSENRVFLRHHLSS